MSIEATAARDRAQRRVLTATAGIGVAALGVAGFLAVGLDGSSKVPVSSSTTTTQDPAQQQQPFSNGGGPPMATSGSS